jgi:hypothetical protein
MLIKGVTLHVAPSTYQAPYPSTHTHPQTKPHFSYAITFPIRFRSSSLECQLLLLLPLITPNSPPSSLFKPPLNSRRPPCSTQRTLAALAPHRSIPRARTQACISRPSYRHLRPSPIPLSVVLVESSTCRRWTEEGRKRGAGGGRDAGEEAPVVERLAGDDGSGIEGGRGRVGEG